MKTVMVNGRIAAKRGIYKAFREHLNATYPEIVWRAGARGQYGNRTREYGDWLFFQDRPMFDELLWRTLQGCGEEGFNSNKWIVS